MCVCVCIFYIVMLEPLLMSRLFVVVVFCLFSKQSSVLFLVWIVSRTNMGNNATDLPGASFANPVCTDDVIGRQSVMKVYLRQPSLIFINLNCIYYFFVNICSAPPPPFFPQRCSFSSASKTRNMHA